MNDTRRTVYQRQIETESLQSRYALRVASRLSERAAMVEHHVDERLRVARERALDRALQRRAAASSPGVAVAVAAGAGVLAMGGGHDDSHSASWWTRLGALLPLIALVAGLMLIQYQHARLRTAAVADIDVDLLVDELPPRAYSDPGFVEFLKTAQQ